MAEFGIYEAASFIAQQTDERDFYYKDFHQASTLNSSRLSVLASSIQRATNNKHISASFGSSLTYDSQNSVQLSLLPKINFSTNFMDLRKSGRIFSKEPLTIDDLNYIFTFLFGTSPNSHHRAYSSAGACYPNELFLNIRNVKDIENGIYLLSTSKFRLIRVGKLIESMTMDTYEVDASLTIVCVCLFSRVTYKYGERGYRFALLEAGAISQMIELASASRELAAVSSGSYLDTNILNQLGFNENQAGVMTSIHLGRRGENLDY